MGIDHRGGNILMTEEFLHSSDVVAAAQQMGGKRMAQGMGRGGLGNARFASRFPVGALQERLRVVMPAHRLGARINRKSRGEKRILPDPLAGGPRVFAFKREGQKHFPMTMPEILLVEGAHLAQMDLEGKDDGLRKQRDTILGAFAVAHMNLTVIEVEVFDAQAHRLHQTQAGPIKKRGQKKGRSIQVGQEPAGLGLGENDRKSLRLFGALEMIHPGEREPQDFLVKE